MTDYSTFEDISLTKGEAFRKAREELGTNRFFKYNGYIYNTATKDDKKNKLFKYIPEDNNKYKIEKNNIFVWRNNDWEKVILRGGDLIPVSLKKYKKEKPKQVKFTAKEIINNISADPRLRKKYPDIVELAESDLDMGEYLAIEELRKNPVFKNAIQGETPNIQDIKVTRINPNNIYNSFNPFYGKYNADISQLSEYIETTKFYNEVDGIDRREGNYTLVQMADETTDPANPEIYVDPVENQEILELLLSMPNSKEEAEAMNLGEKWADVQDAHDKGFRLLSEEGIIEKGYKEKLTDLDIFNLDLSEQEFTMADAFKEDLEGGVVTKLPFAGDVAIMTELAKIYSLIQKLEEEEKTGEQILTNEELLVLKQFSEKSLRNPNWGATFYNIVTNLPKYGIEFYLTAGTTKVATESAKKVMKAGITRLLSKKGQKVLQNRLTQYAITGSSVVYGNLRGRVYGGMILGTASSTAQRMIDTVAVGEYENRDGLKAVILKDGQGFMEALSNASLDNLIETVTESAGAGIAKGSKQLKEVAFRSAFVKAFAKKNPRVKQSQFNKMLERGGFHGVAVEMAEEELGRTTRGAFHTIGIGDESFEYQLPTFEELSAQLAGFSVMPGIGVGADYMQNGKNRAIAKEVAKYSDRNNKRLYIRGFNKKNSVRAVDRAVQSNKIDSNTGNFIKFMIGQTELNPNLESFDAVAMIKIHEDAKILYDKLEIEKIMKDENVSRKEAEKIWKEFTEGEGLDENTTVAQALGSTDVIKTKDGHNKVLLSLYAGATKNTVLEEFLGVHFKTMSNADMKAYMDIYNKVNTKLTPQEYFEKNGVDYILDNNSLIGTSPLIKFYNEAKNYIKDFLKKASDTVDLPENMEAMYAEIFGKKEFKVNNNVREVNNLSVRQGDKSYDVIPVKDIAIKLAEKNVLTPDLVKSKDYRNKVVNRGVLRGLRDIMTAVAKGNINLNEAQKWYNEEVEGTISIMRESIPAMQTEGHNVFAKLLLAITSNGQKVRTNYNQAFGLVEEYLETGKFTIKKHETDVYKTDSVTGNRVKTGEKKLVDAVFYKDIDGTQKLVGGLRYETAMKNLLAIDNLIKKLGLDGAMRFMLEKHVGLTIQNELGTGGGVTITKQHYGAQRFGKKLGAFFLNMNGISELPTYDLWWTRTYNRWMGTPVTTTTTKKGEVKTALVESPRNDAERSAMNRILNTIALRLTKNKEFNPTGETINPEDVQALLWYLEKDLYINAGARPSDLVSFKTVAEERKGVTDDRFTTTTSPQELEQATKDRGLENREPVKVARDSKARSEEIRKSIREGKSYQITAFHGSDTGLIKKFDPDKRMRTGRQQGWGTYLTDKYELARWYAFQGYDVNNPSTSPTVYEVVVHKGKKPEEYDYLEWGDSPTREQTIKLLEHAEYNLTKPELDVFLNLHNTLQSGEMAEYENIVWGNGQAYNAVPGEYFTDMGRFITRDIYTYLSTVFYKRSVARKGVNPPVNLNDTLKETSEFLLKAGIDGLTFVSGVKPAGLNATAKGIVVFDANEIDIRKKTSYQLKSIKTRLELSPETLSDYFFQKLVDKYHRMKVVQDTLKYVSPDTDVYLKMIQFPGKTKFKVEKVGKDVEKIIEAVINSGFTMEQFEDYLYAKHAISRNKLIKERSNGENLKGSGMTDKKALEIQEEFDGTKLERIANTFHRKVTKPRLELLRKSGLINQEQYDQYKSQWDFYVPLKSPSTVQRIIQNVRSGFNVQGRDVHTATGRSDRARNVILQAVADYQETIKRVEQQKVVKALAKLIRKNPSELWKIKRPTFVKTKPIWDDDGNFEYVGSKELADNEIGFREIDKDGKVKQYVIEINDSSTVVRDKFGRVVRNPLVTTMNNLGVEKSVYVLNKLNSFLRRNYTTWNPDFIITNFERDIQTAFANLNIDYNPKIALQIVNDTRKALVGIYKNTRGYKKAGVFGNDWKNLYEEYKREGGQMGWFDSKSIEEKMSEIENKIRLAGSRGNTRKTIGAIVQWIEDMNETVEQAVRLSTYYRMKKSGLSKAKAVAVAKDLTINFNRKGEWSSLINSFYLFFNAGVQGAVNVGRRAIGTPTGVAVASGLFASGMLNQFYNKAVCENYDDEVSAYEKDNYMIFMKPNCKMGFKLRMPYGWGMFKALGSIFYDYMDNTIKFGDAIARAFVSADHSFNPMGGGTAIQALSPTITDPLVMIGEGKDFKGDDLYPYEYSKNVRPDFMKHKKYTSDIYVKGAKWVSDVSGGNDYQGGFFDVSPETYKTWVNFLGGGALSTIQRNSAIGVSLMKDARLPRVRNDEGTINFQEIPLVRTRVLQTKPYLKASKVFEMLRKADVRLYNKEDVQQFRRNLQDAVVNGDISHDDAYGKNGDRGMLNEFLKRQNKLYINLGN